VCFEVPFEGVKSDGDTLTVVGIWFQISGAAEKKARRPKSVFVLGRDVQERLARGTQRSTVCFNPLVDRPLSL